MRLGVDASNIRAGGGLQHLRELLAAADPGAFGIKDVYVWSGSKTLTLLPDRPWLHRMSERALDGGLIRRTAWRKYTLKHRLAEVRADVLFVPGGIYTGGFRPFVAVSQNVLPFQEGERQRYGWSFARLRLELVRRAQLRTFRAADGVVFPTRAGQLMVERLLNPTGLDFETIPCGVNQQYQLAPRPQHSLGSYSAERPFRWLYVSTIDLYKHQWNVVAAVGMLRKEGLPVALDLIGVGTGRAKRLLADSLATWDPDGDYVRSLGRVRDIVSYYWSADAAVFASSCETPGFVLLESMAAGLPIACSDRSGMPEALGDAGIYFDPEDPDSISAAMRRTMESTVLRSELSLRAYERSQMFTWTQCADGTLGVVSACHIECRGNEDESL